MDYEERIKQEIKTMKAKRAFALQANDYDAFCDMIDELCAFTVKKQIANQMHFPDNFEGIKVINTCGYDIEELQPCCRCVSVVKENDEWHVCNTEGQRLPINGLKLHSLLNVEEALLEVWENIIDWEKELL